jgi:hypothetical protein
MTKVDVMLESTIYNIVVNRPENRLAGKSTLLTLGNPVSMIRLR